MWKPYVSKNVKNVMCALYEIFETSGDPITTLEAHWKKLNSKEPESFKFLSNLIIRYELLTEVNIANRNFQNPNMQLHVSIKTLKRLIVFLEKYRENGFEVVMENTEQLVVSIEVKLMFQKKKSFSYETDETPQYL